MSRESCLSLGERGNLLVILLFHIQVYRNLILMALTERAGFGLSQNMITHHTTFGKVFIKVCFIKFSIDETLMRKFIHRSHEAMKVY